MVYGQAQSRYNSHSIERFSNNVMRYEESAMNEVLLNMKSIISAQDKPSQASIYVTHQFN